MVDLATEEARAMSGRPAWRVAAACIKGVACPRCDAEQGVRCKGKTTCRERVWRQRALERASKNAGKMRALAFFEAVTSNPTLNLVFMPNEDLYKCETADISSGAMDVAIITGMVRLTTVDGLPVWLTTEAGASLAMEWADAKAEPPMQPVAPPIDAAAATQAFLERAKP